MLEILGLGMSASVFRKVNARRATRTRHISRVASRRSRVESQTPKSSQDVSKKLNNHTATEFLKCCPERA